MMVFYRYLVGNSSIRCFLAKSHYFWSFLVDFWSFLTDFGPFLTDFGHFWSIFGHFWPFLVDFSLFGSIFGWKPMFLGFSGQETAGPRGGARGWALNGQKMTKNGQTSTKLPKTWPKMVGIYDSEMAKNRPKMPKKCGFGQQTSNWTNFDHIH